MLQFYFLSVFFNFVGGMALSADFLEKRLSLFNGLGAFFERKNKLKPVLGIISFIVGILKLLSVVDGDVAVVGDLVPALGGIMLGLALLTVYYRGRSDVGDETKSSTFLEKYRIFIGIISMVIGVVHFLLPRVLFL